VEIESQPAKADLGGSTTDLLLDRGGESVPPVRRGGRNLIK